jgi:transcriptional regulator with XRE-family HTH domain
MKTVNPFLTQIGKKIRIIRKVKKISYKTICEKTGLSSSCILDIEMHGRNPHLMTLKMIADVLECDVKDFL